MSESIRTLTDLISRTSADRFLQTPSPEDLGLAEHLPFPFLAIVGQREMKLAILLALINPNMGGVLLIGPRGTGKTTAVRGITELLPNVPRSRCSYGCLPEDITAGGIEAVCPDCARRFGEGEELTYQDKVRLIELHKLKMSSEESTNVLQRIIACGSIEGSCLEQTGIFFSSMRLICWTMRS